ncbi:MAG: GNAT family N-acetyltransferase [Acidobacteriota bacterium]|nr:GNAT family N-acetyltransferase [Acidobacteriota bacterium]
MLLAPYDGRLFLSAMRVRPAFRRLGVASELTRRAIREGVRSCCPVWLVVHERNHVAVHLYKKADFHVVESETPIDRPGHLTMVHLGDGPRSARDSR